MQLSWSIQDIWNKELIFVEEEKDYSPRNYIRASEIGSPFLDRFYKMKGIPPTNPFDERTLRKFEAGRTFEWLVGNVLKKSGLLTQTQGEVKIQLDGYLPVIGHYDYKISPPTSWDEARKNVLAVEYPRWIEQIALKIIDYLQSKYPIIYGTNGKISSMKTIIYEIKSVNSIVFWSKMRCQSLPYEHHKLQLFTYLKGTGIEEGRILYISKDDLTIYETGVFLGDKELERRWEQDIKEMSFYIQTDKEPEKEPDIVYDEDKNKWVANWRIAFSPYLTKITGFKTKEEWEASLKEKLKEANKQCRKTKKSQ